MEEFKHGKYIVTQPKKDLVVPAWGGTVTKDPSTRMMYLDSEVIKGAFYVECMWFWPTTEESKGSPEPHTHDYDEVIAFFGTNFENPNDLGGVIELWIDGQKNLMNQSFLAFIPAGIVHCPLKAIRIDRPILHFATGPGKQYGGASK
jgi:hypothetical protein